MLIEDGSDRAEVINDMLAISVIIFMEYCFLGKSGEILEDFRHGDAESERSDQRSQL